MGPFLLKKATALSFQGNIYHALLEAQCLHSSGLSCLAKLPF